MEIGIYGIVGLVLGLIVGYLVMRVTLKKSNHAAIEDINKKSDLALAEAKLSAKRIVDDAENKAEKVLARAENKHEQIKQKKIQEAKDRYSELRSSFEEEKNQYKISIKERELEVSSKEKELQTKMQSYTDKEENLQAKESEIVLIKENLEKQIKIVEKKKSELDAANDERIKTLEKLARMSESEAKELLLEAVKGKAELDAMALTKNTIEAAKLNANKEAKKIVIQSIQRMCAEYTIENTVSVFNLEVR